jgi:RNA polymerase sigma-70 factor (ECF subfamily)
MDRTNDTWLAELRGAGSEQQAALAELRDALARSLRRAISGSAAADDAFVEDVVQDSLVRILDRLEQFQGRSRFLTWATAIAIRVAMSELRRRRWRDVSLDAVMADGDFLPATAADAAVETESALERKAILDAMHNLIQYDLSDKQRVALVAELKGMPQDEIARQLGSNRNAIYKLTHDARKRLKRGLEAAGYAAADIQAAFAS